MSEKSFDAVVIGSGLGGLTAAALLAKRGRSVCVIERNHSVGGAASVFKNGDLTIEPALHQTADPHWPGEPKHAILALGYAGWAAGQLESEIQDNGWLHCDADPDLIFGRDIEEKYTRALRKIGIDLGMLSNEAGHA